VRLVIWHWADHRIRLLSVWLHQSGNSRSRSRPSQCLTLWYVESSLGNFESMAEVARYRWLECNLYMFVVKRKGYNGSKFISVLLPIELGVLLAMSEIESSSYFPGHIRHR
jgi:hypothetical protein